MKRFRVPTLDTTKKKEEKKKKGHAHLHESKIFIHEIALTNILAYLLPYFHIPTAGNII